MCEKISSISALVVDAVIHLFRDARRATESCPNSEVISVIQTEVSRALAKGFLSAALYFTVEEAVLKCVPVVSSVDADVAK